MNFQRRIVEFLIFLAATASIPAQDPVFRVSTQLVETSVIATDGSGNPVTNLRKEDFSLLEDGKPMQIAQCYAAAAIAAGPPPALPKGVYTNRPELLPHSPRTVTAIVLDYLNTPWTAQTATREQLLDVLRKLDPNDIVALYTMGTELQVLHDYTTDRKSLVEQLGKSPGLLSLRSRDTGELLRLSSARWERAFGERSAQADNASRATLQRSRTLLTLQTLSILARHMAGIPGRKNLVLMSAGFPLTVLPQTTTTVKVIMSETHGLRIDNMPNPASTANAGEASLFLDTMDRTLDSINAAGVSIYGIDVNGLLVPMTPAEDGSIFNVANRDLAAANSAVGDNHASLAELSSRTGGLSTLRSNDISGALSRVLTDARHAYTLTYYSPNDRLDGKARKIDIRTSRPDIKLRYRNTYVPADHSKVTQSARNELSSALTIPISQNAILLTAHLQPGQSGQIDAAVQIESRQLALLPNKDRWTGAVDILLYQLFPDGKMKGQQLALPLNLDSAAYQTLLRKGLIVRKSLTREKDAFALRIVVRDANTGNIGTLDAPFAHLSN